MKYGNLVIVGHNYKDGQFFGNLKELTKEDIILLISTDGSILVYEVYDKYKVKENDISCISQETNGKIELTLITCDDDNTKRLIVKCRALE